jgi:hypothetical protein
MWLYASTWDISHLTQPDVAIEPQKSDKNNQLPLVNNEIENYHLKQKKLYYKT